MKVISTEGTDVKVVDTEIVDDNQIQPFFPANLLFVRELTLLFKTLFSGISVVICLVGLILFAWSNPILQPVFASIATYVIHNFVKVYMF